MASLFPEFPTYPLSVIESEVNSAPELSLAEYKAQLKSYKKQVRDAPQITLSGSYDIMQKDLLRKVYNHQEYLETGVELFDQETKAGLKTVIEIIRARKEVHQDFLDLKINWMILMIVNSVLFSKGLLNFETPSGVFESVILPTSILNVVLYFVLNSPLYSDIKKYKDLTDDIIYEGIASQLEMEGSPTNVILKAIEEQETKDEADLEKQKALDERNEN